MWFLLFTFSMDYGGTNIKDYQILGYKITSLDLGNSPPLFLVIIYAHTNRRTQGLISTVNHEKNKCWFLIKF